MIMAYLEKYDYTSWCEPAGDAGSHASIDDADPVENIHAVLIDYWCISKDHLPHC